MAKTSDDALDDADTVPAPPAHSHLLGATATGSVVGRTVLTQGNINKATELVIMLSASLFPWFYHQNRG